MNRKLTSRACAVFCGCILATGQLFGQDAETSSDAGSEATPTSQTSSGSGSAAPQAPPQTGKPAGGSTEKPARQPFVPRSTSSGSGEGPGGSPSTFDLGTPPPTVSGAGAPRGSNPAVTSDAPIGGSDLFSFGDLVSSYFEMTPPGDPNHPDKLRLTIGSNVGYDTNVLTTATDPLASPSASLNATGTYGFGSERLKFGTGVALGATYYQDRPSDKMDYNAGINANVSYFVTRRLQVEGGLQLAYLSQPNPLLIGGSSRFSGDYLVTNLSFDASYALRPRLAITTGYQISGIKYTDESVNQQQGFINQSYQLGLRYLLSPRLTISMDYRYNPVTYYEADLGSEGHILTVGFEAQFTTRLKWKLDFGAEQRLLKSPETMGDSTYLGPFLDTELNYELRPGAQLSASLRYATEPSGLSAISIRETLRGTLALQYTFYGKLTTSLGLVYENDRYDQPGTTGDFTQTVATGYIGLQYLINPAVAVTARFDYTDVTSEVELNQYTRSVTTLGLQVIF